MPVNNLTFNQSATLLNAIVNQATGKSSQTPTNTSEFVSVAQTALLTGKDAIINSLSQVVGRTIFSVRPYSAKFAGLMRDAQRWGGIIRKVNFIDQENENDAGYTEGATAVDMYVQRKPKILQTNYYGSNIWQKAVTIHDDQYNAAFTGVDSFNEFIAGIMQNMSDSIEQTNENASRACLANLIGGILAANKTDQIIHLLSEYNTLTGGSYTAETIMQPANYKPFMQWVYGRVAALSKMLTERTVTQHFNVTGSEILRHTPEDRQQVYLYAPYMYASEAQVLADTYHDNYLRMASTEMVNFWQSLDDPTAINVTPAYLNQTTGAVTTAAQAVTQDAIMGVILDEEAAGMTIRDTGVNATPYNARGRYYNLWYHWNTMWHNDFTEKAVVLLLD